MPNGICHPLKNDPRVLSRKSTVSNKTSDPTHLENDIGFLIQIAGENLKQTVFGWAVERSILVAFNLLFFTSKKHFKFSDFGRLSILSPPFFSSPSCL
jgi:hypothetical protein